MGTEVQERRESMYDRFRLASALNDPRLIAVNSLVSQISMRQELKKLRKITRLDLPRFKLELEGEEEEEE